MQYKNQVMRKRTLEKMGLPEAYLLRIYGTYGQKVAWKMDPAKPNSPLLFDTEELERVRGQTLWSFGWRIGRRSGGNL